MKKAVLLGALLVLAASACGSGGTRLSTTAFRKQANAICARYNVKVKGALAHVGNNGHSLANGMDRAIAYIKKGTKELDALRPPKIYDAKYKHFSRISHDEISTAQKLADAARTKDKSAMNATLTQLESQGEDSDKLATEMGLHTCASG